MFGPLNYLPKLTLPRVFGGLSKTLSFVNQMIPLYKEAKPMINNARNTINLIKEMSNTTTNRIMNNTQKNLEPVKKIINNSNFANQKGPTFFQ